METDVRSRLPGNYLSRAANPQIGMIKPGASQRAKARASTPIAGEADGAVAVRIETKAKAD